MGIMLGNLQTFEKLGDKDKMIELESKLKELGYSNEDNIKKNEDKGRKTWHIFDMPRIIQFSVLDDATIELLKSYSKNFNGSVGVTIS